MVVDIVGQTVSFADLPHRLIKSRRIVLVGLRRLVEVAADDVGVVGCTLLKDLSEGFYRNFPFLGPPLIEVGARDGQLAQARQLKFERVPGNRQRVKPAVAFAMTADVVVEFLALL